MIRLLRKGIAAPKGWKKVVNAAFPTPTMASEFWRKARAFERLAEHGKKRVDGFAKYAPHALPTSSKGKAEFPAVWQKHEELRQKIAGMSFGYCAYCQSTVSSTHPGKKGKKKPPGQIEHFRPKSRFPVLAYDWDNYFLSCAGCNTAKSNKWPVDGYVRPDEGRPGARFEFRKSGTVRARKGDVAAANTVKDLDLGRYWLVEHRRDAIARQLKAMNRILKKAGAKVLGRLGIELADFLVAPATDFSGAVNQNVRRAWTSRQAAGR